MFANFKEYNDSIESFQSYVKRLEQSFLLHDVEEKKKVPAIISCMGPKLYNLLSDLTFPKNPEALKYEEIVDILLKHLSPAPNKFCSRIKFRNSYQNENESIQDFVSKLKKLTTFCAFAGETLNENLLEQFLRGLKNESIQSKLLSQIDDLTFEKAIEKAIILQNNEQDISELKNKNVNVNKLAYSKNIQPNKISNNFQKPKLNNVNKGNFDVNKNKLQCYRCGNPSHLANKCKHINTICKVCKKRGHLGKVCKSSSQKQTNVLQTVDILSVSHDKSSTPIKVWVLIENKAKAEMEVDTGSGISAAPVNRFRRIFPNNKIFPPDVQLRTATGEVFTPVGYVTVDVSYANITKNLKLYLIKEDNFPLLFGRDWVAAFNLFPTNFKSVYVNEIANSTDKLKTLLNDFSDLFSDKVGEIKGLKAELYLEKGSTPIFCKARTVTYALRNAVNDEIQRLQDEGIIKPVTSSKWATPIVPVVKPNGKIRLCGDFKVTVNKFLKVEKYPLPRVEDMLATLGGGLHFTKIDLNQAYLQLPVDEKSQEILTINTPKGLFQFLKLPMGLTSSPAIWQRSIEQILSGIDGVTVFIDDIGVTGETDEIHLTRLKQVLERLREYNIRINKEKSIFLADHITYCGYKIDKQGIHKTQDKIEAIVNAPRPINVSQVKAFLGLVTYYSKFVPNLSTIAHPLNHLLKKNVKFIWSPVCEQAFKNIKNEIISERVLTHFNPKLPLVLATDASPYGISAVLSHVMPDNVEKPIGFVSRTLTNAEKKYSQVDKEALAIIFGVKKFFQYLYGNRFTLFTDSKPLVSIFSPNKSIPVLSAARMQRYALYLQAFKYDIRYKKTSEHGNVDALSRLPLRSEDLPPQLNSSNVIDESEFFQINQISTLPLNAKSIAVATKSDPLLRQLFHHLISGSPIPKNLLFGGKQEEFTLQHSCILKGCRVIIPEVHRKQILHDLHYGHFGIVKMKSLARSFVWWPGIDQDIEDLARNCTTCVNLKNNPPKVDTHHWEWPTAPWQRIHIDYFGPVMGKMLLLVVDAHSKWPEVFIVPNTTSEHTITCLSSLFARYGYPISLVSDNAKQFTSEEFETFLKNHGVKHRFSAPYHPATNGQAERYVQILKKGLKALSSESGTLQMKINNFLLQYRKMPHVTTGESPASLFLKRNIRTKIDLIIPNVTNFVHDKQNARKANSKVKEFQINQKVAVRNYTPEAKWKIGRIIAREGKLHYRIQVGSNIWKRHIDQITNVGSKIHLNDDSNSEQRGTESHKSDSQLMPPSVSDLRPADSVVPSTSNPRPADSVVPSTPNPEPADSVVPAPPNPKPDDCVLPNTPSPAPRDSKRIPSVPKPMVSNTSIDDVKETLINSSSSQQVPRRSTRKRKVPCLYPK